MASWFNRSSTGAMSDLWLGDVGIRVTNLERSIEFYTKVFDLEQIDRGGDDEGKYVLFRDRRSGQRLELNWYAERSPFWTPYVSGEALDHFEVRVRSVPETLERLKKFGIAPATRKLWVKRQNRGETERRSEVREAHAGRHVDIAKWTSDRLHSGFRWYLLLPLRPPWRTVGRTNPGSLLRLSQKIIMRCHLIACS